MVHSFVRERNGFYGAVYEKRKRLASAALRNNETGRDL